MSESYSEHWDAVLGKDNSAAIGRIEKDIADTITQQQETNDFYGNLEQTYNREQAQEAAKQDLNFLAPLAIPTVFKFLFPPMFLLVWQLLQTAVSKVRDFTQLVLGIPRGFGKTMLIKLFALFCILFTTRKFILITAATSALAENIIADVIDMLEETNIKRLFGDWKLHVEIDRQELKKFTYRGRPIMLAAIGAGGSLRGLNIKNERPDVMIFEDIQTRECADSKVESDKLERWMIGTAMKAKSPFGCLFIFVGNMYPTPNCILRKLKDNPNWIKFICGGILSDMTSLWEELQPLKQLLAELDNDVSMGHPEIFFAEVLNDPDAGINSRLDLTKMASWKFTSEDRPQGSFVLIDPAGNKGRDDVAIGFFEVYDAIPALREVDEGDYSPGETIKRALLLCLRHGCSLIGVESNAYQATLAYWINVIFQQYGVGGIEVVEIHSGMYSKNSRILEALRQINAAELLVHPEVRSKVVFQASHWNPLKRDNIDNILDLLAYAQKMMNLYGHLMSIEGKVLLEESKTARVIENNSAF